MKKKLSRILPSWAVAPLISAVLCNFLVYCGCNRAAQGWELHSLALPIDEKIPLVSWTIVIYIGCYLFWVVNYILIYRRSREYAYRFFIADFISRLVCLGFFILYPTTLERPSIEGTGFFDTAMRLVYLADAPTNLFPSIHCLVSWFCVIGIWDDRQIPRWYKVFSLVFAVAVFVSTLTTRQHVVLDVAGGVVLAEISYWISQHTGLWRLVEKPFDRMNHTQF